MSGLRAKPASNPLTLVQLARAAGTSLDDVRLYRDSGLLPPPRRQRSRSDDFAFETEHVARLHFIRRARSYAFTLDDIARLVDQSSLVTCGDVYSLVSRRLDEMRRDHGADAPVVAALEELLAICPGKGARQDCRILATLAGEARIRPAARAPRPASSTPP